ncbi:MAG: hypothetical protein OTJ97_11160, partial [SAR202 cluster bacterium]|nr:hypothetical protein [SAR202 cluster bacterium]
TWVLEASMGELILRHPGADSLNLTADSETVFSGSGLVLSFVREGDRAVAFVLQAGRVQNLRFDRVR